jgi:hypothetical protein
LDECDQIPSFDPEWLPEPDQMFDPRAIAGFQKSSEAYEQVKEQAKVYWDAAADNHTHG